MPQFGPSLSLFYTQLLITHHVEGTHTHTDKERGWERKRVSQFGPIVVGHVSALSGQVLRTKISKVAVTANNKCLFCTRICASCSRQSDGNGS